MQLATFGRRLEGQRDALPGYVQSKVQQHANVTPTGNMSDRVAGTAFDVDDEQLFRADAFEEQFDYWRVQVTLASGRTAWVYVHRPR